MRLFFLLASLLLVSRVKAQRTDRKLEKEINRIVQGFHGEVGIYVKNLKTGKVAAFQSDSLFPTASMVKIPILVGIMDKIARGELQYHQELIYNDSLLYPGSDILGSFKSGEKIELSKVMLLSLSTSDNTASLWLQSLAGGGKRINEVLDSLGLQYTRVNSRTPGRRDNWEVYGWGQSTPHEMVSLMEKIYRGQVINKEVSNRMLRVLGRNYWDEEAISQIPPTIFVASKNGAVNEARSETLLVMAPHGPYIFSIMTKNQEDQSWKEDNEGWELARKLSGLLWSHYEPRFK